MREDSQACTFDASSQYVDLAAEVFSLLSVGEIAERVGKSPTVVSQHLAKWRWARIVATRQEGTRVYYNLIDEHARQLVTHAVFQAEHVVGDTLPRHHIGASGLPVADGDAETAP